MLYNKDITLRPIKDMYMKDTKHEKLSNMCWDLWFVVDALETSINNTEKINNKKDSSCSCLFNFQNELDVILEEIETLKVINNR